MKILKFCLVIAGAFFVAGQAGAQIVVHTLTPNTAAYVSSPLFVDLLTGESSTTLEGIPEVTSLRILNVHPTFTYLAQIVMGTGAGATGGWVQAGSNNLALLDYGTAINAASSFTPGAYFDPNWETSPSSTGYAGFFFKYASAIHYGWAYLTREDDAIILHTVAWNSVAGEDILAGQTAIPEPSTYVLLMGLGMLGIVLWRRAKGDQSASPPDSDSF